MNHNPKQIPSPDGTGIATTYACTCGEGPSKGATSGSTMASWFRAHARKHGARVSPSDYAAAYEAFKALSK